MGNLKKGDKKVKENKFQGKIEETKLKALIKRHNRG